MQTERRGKNRSSETAYCFLLPGRGYGIRGRSGGRTPGRDDRCQCRGVSRYGTSRSPRGCGHSCRRAAGRLRRALTIEPTRSGRGAGRLRTRAGACITRPRRLGTGVRTGWSCRARRPCQRHEPFPTALQLQAGTGRQRAVDGYDRAGPLRDRPPTTGSISATGSGGAYRWPALPGASSWLPVSAVAPIRASSPTSSRSPLSSQRQPQVTGFICEQDLPPNWRGELGFQAIREATGDIVTIEPAD